MLSANPIHFLSQRLPSRRDALEVFGVIVFAVFGWSLRGFLYKIPAFTLYFGLSSNLAILSYMFAFALLESSLVMGVLLMLSVVLPPRVFRQDFAYKAFIVVVIATAASIVFESWYRTDFFKGVLAGDDYAVPPFVAGAVVTIILVIALLRLFRVRPGLQKLARLVMDQVSVFTYIYVPLGLIGLIVVLIRNIL